MKDKTIAFVRKDLTGDFILWLNAISQLAEKHFLLADISFETAYKKIYAKLDSLS